MQLKQVYVSDCCRYRSICIRSIEGNPAAIDISFLDMLRHSNGSAIRNIHNYATSGSVCETQAPPYVDIRWIIRYPGRSPNPAGQMIISVNLLYPLIVYSLGG